ncbi:MAG: GNAT family N-acetyltransferase [Thermoguttaceae bacterium]
MTSNDYYREFSGRIFVIQVENEAVENTAIAYAILREVRDLLAHGIRVVLVFGKGSRCEEELRTRFGSRLHGETNRLVVPEKALTRLEKERRRVTGELTELCVAEKIPFRMLPESVVTAERRIGHESTGTVARIDLEAIGAVVAQNQLAIVGFGGRDDHGRFLHVPSVSLSADLAVGLQAQKLLLLMQRDGIRVPGRREGWQQLSFADFEELLCLLQKTDEQGRCILFGSILPKVHASLRAVAGGVEQVHIVSYTRLLDEILTRTGVGTMIEWHQRHHVDYAQAGDLDAIEQLHAEAQHYATPRGTPLVKPRTREDLARLVPQTLLLRHRQFVIGMMHATEVPNTDGSLLIGGFVIAENHQDSQHGQLLLTEALSRFREKGCKLAVAVTASDRAKRLFSRNGGRPGAERPWQQRMLDAAQARYQPEERGDVLFFQFDLQRNG